MDAESQRFVLKPKGMGQRSAGHLNLDDFYRANSIRDLFLGDQRLELHLAAQYRLDGVLDQIQALTEVLNGRLRHLP